MRVSPHQLDMYNMCLSQQMLYSQLRQLNEVDAMAGCQILPRLLTDVPIREHGQHTAKTFHVSRVCLHLQNKLELQLPSKLRITNKQRLVLL